MKTYKQWFILLILIIASSCSNEQDKNLKNTENPNFIFEKSKLLENYQIPKEDIISLQKLGFSGSYGVAMERTDYLNNETYIYYLMENDIEIRKNSLPSMTNDLLKNKTPHQSKQFHTTNLVTYPRDIRVIAVNFTEEKLIKGIELAIKNYNNLNLALHFTLEYRPISNSSQALRALRNGDILAFQRDEGRAGGSAGFPSKGGAPYHRVYVDIATAKYSVDVCELVFTHEIGHTIGFRHTNYFDRSVGCNFPVYNEGEGYVGAIHIPGTPEKVDIDLESVMLACFYGGEDGEFSTVDITALNYLYKIYE